MSSSLTLHIGVLSLPYHQLLDAAGPVDYLNNHSYAILSEIKSPLASKAPVIHWHYISYKSTLEPLPATSGPMQVPTCTYADCPPLDYLLVPGPDPAIRIPDGCAEFVRSRFDGLKGLLLVCTGSIIIARTGVLDGLNVCSNKMVLKDWANAGKLPEKVKWVGDRRWIVDGKVWSAGGITAGIDLAAEFARVHFDPEIVELVKLFSEYKPNPDQPDVFAKITEGVKLY
ncbi:class I glutamine amidotransferase-like protein [Crucibulum laeve]|uniref:Class I glutamine amidotransferase-like protein n=1 Tax=Crucibulum laeve TaxID=68775 RepID=A0A5C3MHN0_9AGAR|nr:class I glutamine amidotransferase-like protein [Crucibulum laeve]